MDFSMFVEPSPAELMKYPEVLRPVMRSKIAISKTCQLITEWLDSIVLHWDLCEKPLGCPEFEFVRNNTANATSLMREYLDTLQCAAADLTDKAMVKLATAAVAESEEMLDMQVRNFFTLCRMQEARISEWKVSSNG